MSDVTPPRRLSAISAELRSTEIVACPLGRTDERQTVGRAGITAGDNDVTESHACHCRRRRRSATLRLEYPLTAAGIRALVRVYRVQSTNEAASATKDPLAGDNKFTRGCSSELVLVIARRREERAISEKNATANSTIARINSN